MGGKNDKTATAACPDCWCRVGALGLQYAVSDRLSAIDWNATPAAGTISVSQPRLFRRASLINERRLDADWLNQQLEASRTIDFKPEIARELEQITAFARRIGSGIRSRERVELPARQRDRRPAATDPGDRLQLQLDQLKRDAELAREKFATQTELVNSVPSAASASAPSPAVSGVSAAAADQLKSSIDRLITSITMRGWTPRSSLRPSHRPARILPMCSAIAAYRDLLKSARNA
ncbi:MAG: hypothetical protein IPI83_14085, partial [Sphingomonadales bacterium]|nr:hypothetical protein [Sphingomonadales bacterium]